ncbi:dihydroorotate dehydrogenase [Bacillus sp. FJAT-29790]|uniref:dihydroorotate dehydrogenase n=1 Tax=Bacillus sp. FJAT-29790 TaxID=1895002 RepID=UPI001C22BEDB|nr:dihydroorotate dehydrogenase [Bacillus sp. FJAT-29790]MBU8880124.1 dihydroorotate dehydrogenase [Bacillus sp. FJAT-29790]
MPDWSYHPLFKPWLARLPGTAGREFIHRGMNVIANLPGGKQLIEFFGHMEPSARLNKNLFDCNIQYPVGLSGKIDPFLSGTKAFSHLGFGFIEVGPVTLMPNQSGDAAKFIMNKESVLFPDPLESIGLEKTLQRLEKHKLKIPLFIRLSANHIAPENISEELIKLAKPLQSFASAFIIEYDQLNFIKEQRFIDDFVRPIIISIPHSRVEKELPQIRLLLHTQAIKGIMIEEIKDGDRTAELATSLKLLNENGLANIPTVISGGVYEPEDALTLYSLGADLILLSEGYVVSGPGLPKRINEALSDVMNQENAEIELAGWKWYWLFGCIILCGGLLALFFSMTRVILPYDENFLQISRAELIALNPNLIKFMAHDRMTLAGTMISGAILYIQLAKNGVRYGLHWTRKAINIAAISGFLGILLFIGYGYFDWLHGLFWLILLPFFIWAVYSTRGAIQTPISKNRKNTSAWKKALLGQLCFVILGFSFVIGGVVISTIGVTNVFVPTDLGFICIPAELLNNINSRLIPVIAHDRAGFGSALLSVGLLVLMMALWGFQQGAEWVWNSFLYGGIPAFSAGILTHFVIGYTTFIHLLPAYFAFIMYVFGLILSRDFLINKT